MSENWREMVEGRALDALVARAIGLTPCVFTQTGSISGLVTMWKCEHGFPKHCYPVNQDAVDHPHSCLEHYSTDDATAMGLLDDVLWEMRSPGWNPDLDGGLFAVFIRSNKLYGGYAPTLALAICRAVLAVKEATDGVSTSPA